ncbi:hypothetical protein OROHE_018796 [Orobanche hederae]
MFPHKMSEKRMHPLVATTTVMIAVGMALAFHCDVVEATTYTVGDDRGWDLYMTSWPTGKSFKVNDELVFRWPYKDFNHTVVAVNKKGYDGCTVSPESAKVYQSGNDTIKLVKGSNYFICSIGANCKKGDMKIAVTAN